MLPASDEHRRALQKCKICEEPIETLNIHEVKRDYPYRIVPQVLAVTLL